MQCPYIKNAVRINHDGNMVPCCSFKGESEYFVGTNTVDEYLESAWVNDLETTLETGQYPKGCWECMKQEQQGLKSIRQDNLSGFYVDIVVGNVCNSDCGMCGPERSSKIVSRLKHHPLPVGLVDPEDDRFLVYAGTDNTFKLNEMTGLSELLNRATHVKLIGGEPFLVKEIWATLESLNKNVNLSIITNASTISDYQFDILKQFKNLSINVSTEGVGNHYEWVRYGLQWDVFSKNAIKLKTLTDKFALVSTVSALNITNVDMLARYGYENGLFVDFWPIHDPKILSLPMVSRQIISETIDKLQRLVPTNSYSIKALETFTAYVSTLVTNAPHATDSRTKQYITYLNKTRGTGYYLDPENLEVKHGLPTS